MPTPTTTVPMEMSPGAMAAPDERNAEGEHSLKRRARTQPTSPTKFEDWARRPHSQTPKRDGNSETSSIQGDWSTGVPGPDCSVNDLRWFVIREMGDLKQSLRTLNAEQKKKPDKPEVIEVFDKGAARFAMKDHVDRLIHENFELMKSNVDRQIGAIKSDLDKLSNWANEHHGKASPAIKALTDKTEKIAKDLDEHSGKAIGEIQALKGKADKLTNDLNGYDGEIKKAFQHVERVEQAFHGHVGQAFDALAAQTARLQEHVNGLANGTTNPGAAPRDSTRTAQGATPGVPTFNSSPNNGFPGGTSPPAGAHDGDEPGSAAAPQCQPCGRDCAGHCWHVDSLWQSRSDARRGGDGSGGTASSSGGLGGRQACHCAHHDRLSDRVDAAERRLHEAESKLHLIRDHDAWKKTPAASPDKQDHQPGGPYGGDRDGAPGHPGNVHGAPHGPHGHGPGGRGDGHDPGRGGSGDVRDYDPRAPFADGPIENIEKLFDNRIALSESFHHAGGDGGDKWRAKLRGHWVARCPVLLPMLDWAERHDAIRIEETAWHQKLWRIGGQYRRIPDEQVTRLSELVWGFLNICLKENARTIFESAKMLNGFDAWRAVVLDIQKGRMIRLDQLRKIVRNPPHITKMEDVNNGILKFENSIREYIAVGGEPPNDREKKSDLLDTMPQEVRENLMWKLPDEEPFEKFRNHVAATANNILYHRGRIAWPLNAVSTAHEACVPGPASDVSRLEEMIGAVMKKMGYRREGQQGPRTPPTTRPPTSTSTRTPRCVNCGSDKHLVADCTRPKVSLERRPCYECGKPGHVARDCRNRKSPPRTTASVEQDQGEDSDFFGCVECSPWPTPRAVTMKDFVPTKTKNPFIALESDDENSDHWVNNDHWVNIADGSDSDDLPDETAGPSRRQRKRRAAKAAKSLARQGDRAKDNKNKMVIIADDDDSDEESTDKNKLVAPIEYESDDEELFNMDDEVEIEVAQDSGSVDHCANPKDIPKAVKIVKPENGKLRNFVAANGDRIKNYGKAHVSLIQEGGNVVDGSFNVADVTRPLHSTGKICDESKEVLFTKGEATVVPAGALSQFLGAVRHIAKYKRDGGLYLAKMKVRVRRDGKPANKPGFGRQGAVVQTPTGSQR